MKILIVTPHFYPETFKCNDLAFELKGRGHNVSVLTAIPDYPQGKFHEGYGIFKRRTEVINGVHVYRSLIIPRGSGSSTRLAINYLSYTIFACLKAIYLSLTKKFDVVIVHETSPIMVGIPAVIIKKIQKIPIYFWVLDLWPESLIYGGGIKNKYIIKAFDKLTKWIYNNSKTILISSKGFRKSINQKGDYDNRIVYFPNWVDEIALLKKTDYVFPNGFNVLFTGNIGEAQDFPHILKAAQLLRSYDINIILVGDGRCRKWVEKTIKEKDITNVKYLGRYPIENMASFYAQADVLFLSLKDSSIFSLTAPAKLQAYMASGKPIVAMLNGEGADLISEANCGWSVPAEDSEGLAKLLIYLSKEDKTTLIRKGENGKLFSRKHFNFKNCIDNLEKFINK